MIGVQGIERGFELRKGIQFFATQFAIAVAVQALEPFLGASRLLRNQRGGQCKRGDGNRYQSKYGEAHAFHTFGTLIRYKHSLREGDKKRL
ncbi:MAG: hypothetical protein NTY01_22060 [Verrucomicrobia bacterium]|nr:hypothetical protein [Verrucomicrobiota bacterium]